MIVRTKIVAYKEKILPAFFLGALKFKKKECISYSKTKPMNDFEEKSKPKNQKSKSAPPRSTKHEEKYQREEKLKQSLFQLFCRIDDITK